jgi:hypothetical protein
VTLSAISLIISALVRFVAVYTAARGCVMLNAKSKNYRTAPWYVLAALGLFMAITTASIAELIGRALTKPPPLVLLTGYGISLSLALLGLAFYSWLLGSWLPEAIQAQRQRRAQYWRARLGMWPCIRRRMVMRELLRKGAQGAVRAGRVNRALRADNPPIVDDLSPVTPGKPGGS